MGYRTIDRPPAKPEDFLPIFDMYNNEDKTWAIPCFYFNVEKPIDWHDHMMHDFLGWPNPRKPDHICQALPDYGAYTFSPGTVWNYIDMNKAIPIHLSSEYEGYDSAYIAFDEKDESGNDIDQEALANIGASAQIRTTEDWIVDLSFSPRIEPFAGKPKEFIFNAYLARGNSVDHLLRAKLVLMPGWPGIDN